MKRSLLLSALAMICTTTAMAQSSVTVYGRLNTSIERQKDFGGVKGTNTGVFNNQSRIGFKGVEELGGSLKAGFVLEHRFNSDTGASTNGNAFWGGFGSAEVNLAGGFGMLRAGHYTSEAYFATSDVTDLLNHGTGTSSDQFYRYLGNDDNKVSYRTPDFGGLTAEAAVSAGEGIPGRSRIYDVAANYAAGPLGLGFGFEKVKGGDQQFAIRALYDFSPFLVTGYVQRYKNELLDESQNIFRVSGMYTLGSGEFHLAFGSKGDLGPIDDSAKQYTIGYNYLLSKRSKVYTYFNKVNADAANGDYSTIAVGMRHNF